MYYDEYGRQLREAIDACYEALDYLYAAQEHLHSARNWGIFDIFGGGIIATLAKRRKMDKALRYMNDARDSLLRLKSELLDVDEMTDLHLDMDDLVSFSDYFFDGFLFSDVMVQNRINDARSKLNDTIECVEDIRDELKTRLNDL